MHILVAIQTKRELNFVEGRLPRRRMALRTGDVRVFLSQGERRLAVFADSILRRLEAVQGMARFAGALVGSLCELSAVGIRLMTVCTEFEGNLFLEVASVMASFAADLLVFPLQRILCRRMIELRRKCGSLLPCSRGMAFLAGLLESSMMHISVAVRAAAELQANVVDHSISALSVALLAVDVDVRTRQRVLRFRVVEDLPDFPVGCVVALFAAGPQGSAVLVFVATDAVLRKSEVRPV